MTNTREEVAVAEALAKERYKHLYENGDADVFMELAKAAIAAYEKAKADNDELDNKTVNNITRRELIQFLENYFVRKQ